MGLHKGTRPLHFRADSGTLAHTFAHTCLSKCFLMHFPKSRRIYLYIPQVKKPFYLGEINLGLAPDNQFSRQHPLTSICNDKHLQRYTTVHKNISPDRLFKLPVVPRPISARGFQVLIRQNNLNPVSNVAHRAFTARAEAV